MISISPIKHMDNKKIKKTQNLLKNLFTLSPDEFEDLCLELLKQKNIKATKTKKTRDGGIDIFGVSSDPLLGGKIIVQCKRYQPANPISEPKVRSLHGLFHKEKANIALLITTSYFTGPAINYAKDTPIKLINGSALKDIIKKLCPNYKTIAENTIVEDLNQNLLKKGELFQNKGDYLNAIDEFKMAIRKNRNMPANWVALGFAYLNGSDNKELEKKYEHKNRFGGHYALLQEAEKAFYKSLAIDDNYVDAYLGLNELYRTMNISDRQIEVLKKAHLLEPFNIEILHDIATIYEILADEERFQYNNPTHYSQTLSLKKCKEIQKIGRKKEVKYLKEGLKYIEKAIKIDNLSPMLYFSKGLLHKALDNNVEAEQAFYKTEHLDPQHYKNLVRKALGNLTEEERIDKELKDLDYKHMRHRISDDEFYSRRRPLYAKKFSFNIP